MHYDTFKNNAFKLQTHLKLNQDKLNKQHLSLESQEELLVKNVEKNRRKHHHLPTHLSFVHQHHCYFMISLLFKLVLLVSCLLSLHLSQVSAGGFGSTLGSLFSGRQQNQFSGNLNNGAAGNLIMGTAGGVMGTRIMSNNGRIQQQQSPASGNILSGLIPGLDGLFGGGSGGGSSGSGGGFLPPGMTMTQDGCLCPVPKGRTKYIAVEVPQIIFVPPKEKAKVITIKEIREVPASKYSKDDDEEEEDSFDSEKGGGSYKN